jgi:predicted ATP-grasp superfamily ATP-dependent carboligase
MLNKLSTYQAAAEAGVPTPGFWIADSAKTLSEIRSSLTYPIIVKPLLGHIFEGKTGKKLLIAGNFDETVSAVGAMTAAGTGAVLMEMIPGPDDRLCSYFTYLDENSEPMFHFTKRVIRRYPVLSGTACYHITDWIPEAVELGVRLFKHVRLRGVANVEFKRDVRDGRLKLIECNARFTASDSLVARSGVDIGAFVYNRLTGRAQKQIKTFKQGLRMWDPIRDFQCFLYLRKTNNMKLSQWLASVMHRQTFPYFSLLDPMPALARLTLPIRNKLKPAAQTGEAV